MIVIADDRVRRVDDLGAKLMMPDAFLFPPVNMTLRLTTLRDLSVHSMV